jgi:hypothetical protein
MVQQIESESHPSGWGRRLSRLALTCSLIALVLCAWLYLIMLTSLGPGSWEGLSSKLSLEAFETLRHVVDLTVVFASVLLALVAIVLGAFEARRGDAQRSSHSAVDIGIVALAVYGTAWAGAFVGMPLTWMAGFNWWAVISVFAVVTAVAAVPVTVLLRYVHGLPAVEAESEELSGTASS